MNSPRSSYNFRKLFLFIFLLLNRGCVFAYVFACMCASTLSIFLVKIHKTAFNIFARILDEMQGLRVMHVLFTEHAYIQIVD